VIDAEGRARHLLAIDHDPPSVVDQAHEHHMRAGHAVGAELGSGRRVEEELERRDFSGCLSPEACAARLAQLDAEALDDGASETTAVVAMVHVGQVFGASIGSRAWLLGEDAVGVNIACLGRPQLTGQL